MRLDHLDLASRSEVPLQLRFIPLHKDIDFDKSSGLLTIDNCSGFYSHRVSVILEGDFGQHITSASGSMAKTARRSATHLIDVVLSVPLFHSSWQQTGVSICFEMKECWVTVS
jgi:hypothetical protein